MDRNTRVASSLDDVDGPGIPQPNHSRRPDGALVHVIAAEPVVRMNLHVDSKMVDSVPPEEAQGPSINLKAGGWVLSQLNK